MANRQVKRFPAFLSKIFRMIPVMCLTAAIAVMCSVTLADVGGGRGTNQIPRLPNRLDSHSGMVINDTPGGTIQLYKDEDCTQQAIDDEGHNHYLSAGDWVVADDEYNPLVTYPITTETHATIDANNSYAQYYITHDDYVRWIANGTGSFSGVDWDQNAWYNTFSTDEPIKYTWQGDTNYDSPVYVSNNVGFTVIDDDNGYYWLVTNDGNNLIMSASMGEDCYYGHDPVNANYTWNCISNPSNTDGLKQGMNTIYYAGMDIYGDFQFGSGNKQIDTLAPAISTNLKDFMGKHNGWINASDLRKQYKITAKDDTSQTTDVSGVHGHSLRYQVDGSDWSVYQPFTIRASDAAGASSNMYNIKELVSWVGEGKHSLTLGINDCAWNQGSEQENVNIDTIAPTCTPSISRSSWSNYATPITLDYEDATSGVATAQYKWSQSAVSSGDGDWKNYSNGDRLTPPGEGTWYLYWQSTDAAGNTGHGRFGPYSNLSQSSGIVSIQIPNANYLTDTDVVTSVYVNDYTGTPIVPTDNATVTFTVSSSDGVCTEQSKAAICPAGNQSLIWFRWHTPSSPGNVTITATLNVAGFSSSNTLVWEIDSPYEYTPPNPTGSDLMPSGFTVTSPPDQGCMTSGSWSTWRAKWIPDWEWHSNMVWVPDPTDPNGKTAPNAGHYEDDGWWEDDGKWQFDSDYYSAGMSASLNVTPDAHSPTASGKTMKSGYGINENASTNVWSDDSSCTTGVQLVSGLYPEFEYETYDRLLEQVSGSSTGGGAQSFDLKENPNSMYGSHVHFTPVDYPDDDYTPQIYAQQVWTPAGMLSSTATDTIQISGNVYDDWEAVPKNK